MTLKHNTTALSDVAAAGNKPMGHLGFSVCTSTYPPQVADAAPADGLHQLVVGRRHGCGRPAALLPPPLHRHGPECVLQLPQDAAGLLLAQGLLPPLLALLATLGFGRFLGARLVRFDDLRDHPGGLLLPLLHRGRGWWRRWRRRWRGRWRRGGGVLLPGGVASREFGRGPRRSPGRVVRRRARSSSLEVKAKRQSDKDSRA